MFNHFARMRRRFARPIAEGRAEAMLCKVGTAHATKDVVHRVLGKPAGLRRPYKQQRIAVFARQRLEQSNSFVRKCDAVFLARLHAFGG